MLRSCQYLTDTYGRTPRVYGRTPRVYSGPAKCFCFYNRALIPHAFQSLRQHTHAQHQSDILFRNAAKPADTHSVVKFRAPLPS